MKPFNPIQLLLKSESLGLGEHLKGSEIAYHLDALETILSSSQTVTKAAQDVQETDVDITVRMLQEKYGVR